MGIDCQPLVTTPAWLCHSALLLSHLRQNPSPFPTLQLSRLPVCHLLILFLGSRWPELSRVEYTPPLFLKYHQYSLQWPTHSMNYRMPSFWYEQVQKSAFRI